MVLQLDNVDGSQNFQPSWALHLPRIRSYSPAIERWRSEVEAQMPESLRRRKDAPELVDKYLWTMAGENSAGDPTSHHDSGNGYGLMADRVERTPPGTPPAQQISNAWSLIQNNGFKDWGEDNSYQGHSFGALGVIAPYDPDPNKRHPLSNPDNGEVSSIKPPNVGDEGLASSVTRPPGWEPPSGYTGQPTESGAVAGMSVMDSLRKARRDRVEGGYGPGATGAGGGGGGGSWGPGEPPPSSGGGGNIFQRGLSAASDVFSAADEGLSQLGLRVPTRFATPGGGQSSSRGVLETAGRGAITPIPALESAQEFAGEAGRVAGEIAPYLPALGPVSTGAQLLNVGRKAGAPLPSSGDVGSEIAKGLVPTTPAEIGLQVLTAGGAGEALTGLPIDEALTSLGRAAYDRGAVKLAANETFDRLAPASILRHERAGAAVAQEAAGIPIDPRSPFYRAPSTDFTGREPIRFTNEPLPRATGVADVATAREGGAGMAREYGAAVGGGASRGADYGARMRTEYVNELGEDAAAAWEKKLEAKGLTWADYGDMRQGFATTTPSWERDPGSASVDTGFRGDPFSTADITKEIRRSVNDVRAQKAGQDAATEMRAAAQRIRSQGAEQGRVAGDEVGGGAAVAGERRVAGRPVDAQSDEAWAARVGEATVKAQKGEAGRFWYDNSATGIINLAHGNLQDADLVARIAAVGSNDITVADQGERILNSWREYQQGQPITRGHRYGAINRSIDRALNQTPEEFDAWITKQIKAGGHQKTSNFYLDMLDYIDPQRAAGIREASGATATVDHWVMRAFGFPADSPASSAQYRTIADGISSVAKELGWTPKQAQAAIWVQQLVESGKPLSTAAGDYASSVAAHKVTLANGLVPAPGSQRYEMVGARALRNAPPEAMAEYAYDVHRAFLDEEGQDTLAKLLKLPVAAPGEPLAGAAHTSGLVGDAAADLVDQYAMARGAALQMDEVHWLRPFNLNTKGLHNASLVDLGRVATRDEVAALHNELADLGEIIIEPTDKGAIVMRMPSDADFAARAEGVAKHPEVAQANKTFQQRLDQAARTSFGAEQSGTIRSLATDGRKLVLDGSDARTAGVLGRPDVREAVDSIRERVAAADESFAAKWDNPAAAAAQPSPAQVREAGAAAGRQQGAEVGAGSALPPGERPKTQWTITPKEGEPYQVETLAGPPSNSTEEAQARLAAAAAEYERLRTAARSDQALGRAQQGAAGVRQLREGEGQVVRVAVRDDAVRALDPNDLAGSAGAVELTDPAGARVLRPGEQPGPGERVMFHGTGAAGVTGELRPGMNLTPNEADADVFARTTARLEDRAPATAAGQDPAFDYSQMKEVQRPTKEKATWVDPQGRIFEVQNNGEHVDVFKGLERPDEVTMESMKPTRAAMEGAFDNGWVRVISHDADRYSARGTIEAESASTQQAYDGISKLAEKMSPAQRAQTDILLDVVGNDRTIHMPLNDFMATGGDIRGAARRQGAQQGRMFGGDVGGGFGFGSKAAATVPVPGPSQPRLPGEGFEEVLPPRLGHWATATRELGGLAGLPRTLMTSGPWDISAVLRNIGILGARKPGEYLNTVKETFKAYGNEAVARAAKEGVESSPEWDSAQRYGVKFWDWGAGLTSAERAPGYEGLNDSVISKWAEQVPWVRGSERAMATAQNVMGMRTWEEWAPRILNNDALTQAQKDARLTDLASVINHSRGFSGSSTAQFLSKLNAFFSAQYTVSRPQVLLDPLIMMLRGSPEARNLAAQSLLAWGGGNAMLLGMLGASGAAAGGLWSVNANPLDSDFGQLKVGNTRYDTLAGMGPLLKLTGRVGAVGSDAVFGTDFARDQDKIGSLLKSYFENKEQPVARAMTDFLQYNKLPDPKDLPTWFVPMLASGIAETVWNEEGLYKAQALPAAAISSLGGGTSTYKNAQDQANSASRDLYGRSFDDLTREERLAAIAKAPERDQKELVRQEKKAFTAERNRADYKDFWSDERKQQFYAEHPTLDAQSWFLEGRSLSTVQAVDRVLKLGIEGKPVKMQGVQRDINADDNSRKAWEDSKDIIAWYNDRLLTPDALRLTTLRMYPKEGAFEKLDDTKKSAVRGNIRELARKGDPEADAWLYWWGRAGKPVTGRGTDMVEDLFRKYGYGSRNYKGAGDVTGRQLSEKR